MKHVIDPRKIKALTFDVFGTVTDWRNTIVREGKELGNKITLDSVNGRFSINGFTIILE